MLYIYQDVYEVVKTYVEKKWPKKRVYTQDNPNARHQNRFIQISTVIKDTSIIHYEYTNGYVELHLEGDYYGSVFTQELYKYLRKALPAKNQLLHWHNWYGMTQGRLRYEVQIDNLLELAEALSYVVNIIDPIIQTYLESQEPTVSNNVNSHVHATNAQLVQCNQTENNEQPVTLCTMALEDILLMALSIPEYQRIYCWPQKYVELLLNDILQKRSHAYHIGTIILQKKKGKYDIIDGQQRLVTLSLILLELGYNSIPLLQESFNITEAQKYVGYNRFIIQTYLNRFCRDRLKREEWVQAILQYVSLDVLILEDESLDLAYTFFSSQNARGKALTDYELLKSHHLRYIPEDREAQQRHLSRRWDNLLIKSEREHGNQSVSIVIGIYLYCLRKWTRRQYWWIKENNRVKNEFEAAPTIPQIPPFGEKFEFIDPIQGGTHFFAFVETFIQHYQQFRRTIQFNILWKTISCSGKDDEGMEGKRRTHWWYGDVIATFLFAYYVKFGEQYLAEALTCITRIVSQLRYETSKANKQSLLDKAGESGIILMINQATSPTFFLAEARDIIRQIPYLDDKKREYIRADYLEKEKRLYELNNKYYSVDNFNELHIL